MAAIPDNFNEMVYRLLLRVPYGRVTTYGQLAVLLGFPGGARRVGRALSHGPSGRGLPYHRVVNSAGRLVPGWAEQADLLRAEGVALRPNGHVDIHRFLWNPWLEPGA